MTYKKRDGKAWTELLWRRRETREEQRVRQRYVGSRMDKQPQREKSRA